MSTASNYSGGAVTLKHLVSGNVWEVSVPSTGPGLEAMREASETAKLIWDELDEKFNPRPERVVVDDDGAPF